MHVCQTHADALSHGASPSSDDFAARHDRERAVGLELVAGGQEGVEGGEEGLVVAQQLGDVLFPMRLPID